MRQEIRVAVAVAVLVGLAGCGGFLGGDTNDVTIGAERAPEGGEFLYVQASQGLPAGTQISARIEASVLGEKRTLRLNTTLEESVPAGTKVYVGGERESRSVLPVMVGKRPAPGDAIGANNSSSGAVQSVTITVDTGEVTAERTFTYGSP